jgi:cell division protein FtsL
VIEGAVAGIELTKRQAILKAQAEIQKIQSYIDDQEAELKQLNACILTHLQSSYFKTLPYNGSQLVGR